MRLAAVASLLLVTAAPAVAWGFARSIVTSPTGDGPEACLYWASRKIPIWINDKGSKDAPLAKEAARQSFVVWMQVDCTDVVFEDRGDTARTDVGFKPDATDNINLVIFRDTDCQAVVPEDDDCWSEGSAGLCSSKYNCWEQSPETIGLTTTTFSFEKGELYDADIEMNGAGFLFTTTDRQCPADGSMAPPACSATDIKNTLVHEIGHVLGLDHVDDPEATMFRSADLGELKKRSLSEDDVEGVCFIYPKDQATRTCISDAGGTAIGDGCGGCSSTPVDAQLAPVLVGLTAVSLSAAASAGRRRRRRPERSGLP